MNNQQQQQQQFQQVGTGLTRYQSAPSSYFASFLNSPTGGDGGFGADDLEQLFNPRASSPESQRVFSRFLSGSDVAQGNSSANLPVPAQTQLNSQFLPPPTAAKDEPQPQGNEYAPPSQMIYQSRNSEENSFEKVSWGSFNSNTAATPVKMGRPRPGGGSSTLIRHSSSPAGLFANMNIENEFGAMGSFGGGNNNNNNNTETSSFPSGSRMNNTQMDSFPSKHSVSGMMDPISEIGENNPLNNDGGFSLNSWDDSSMLPDNFLNGLPDNDTRTFPNAAARDEQNNKPGNRPTTLLSHHLSLPSNSAELEKLLQDSVPCKIRAKRGCATHPRSIAERVRRTKISERMRKLQELVPNMEKQTNTSDMLDLAVDYIKDLQKQVKKLNDKSIIEKTAHVRQLNRDRSWKLSRVHIRSNLIVHKK